MSRNLESEAQPSSITNRQPSRIPPEAIAAVERVLAHRAGVVSEVPGQERWRQTTVEHQLRKVVSHAAEVQAGATVDRDTGLHPAAHVAARALLACALALQTQDPSKTQDPETQELP